LQSLVNNCGRLLLRRPTRTGEDRHRLGVDLLLLLDSTVFSLEILCCLPPLPQNPHMSVLIIGEKTDVTIEAVAYHLREDLGQTVYIANHNDVLDQHRLKGVPCDTFTSIWLRDLRPPSNHTVLEGLEVQEKYTALRSILYGLCNNASSVVPTSPDNGKARNKFYQLQQAAKIGFQIPPHIFSTQRESIEGFFKSHGNVIYKPINSAPIEVSGEIFFVQPIPVNSSILEHTEGTPYFLQKRIPAIADIRVMVFGSKIFAVRIKRSTNLLDSRPEWVKNPQNYSTVELPSKLQEKIHQMQRQLNLSFGCYDFLEDPNGIFWFLEVNVGGQFLWCQLMLQQNGINLNLALEMAKFLAGV
jgi:hypothetical protein